MATQEEEKKQQNGLTPIEQDILDTITQDAEQQTAQPAPVDPNDTGNVMREEEYQLDKMPDAPAQTQQTPEPEEPRRTRYEALQEYMQKLEKANKEREEKNRLSDEELARRTRAKRLAANITDAIAALGQLYAGAKGANTVAVKPEFTDRFNAYYQKEKEANKRKADEDYAAAAAMAEADYNNANAEIAALEKMDLENQKHLNTIEEKKMDAKTKSNLSYQEYQQQAALNEQKAGLEAASNEQKATYAYNLQELKGAQSRNIEIIKAQGKTMEQIRKADENFEKSEYDGAVSKIQLVDDDYNSGTYHVTEGFAKKIKEDMCKISGISSRTLSRDLSSIDEVYSEVMRRIDGDAKMKDEDKEALKAKVTKAYQDGIMLSENDYLARRLRYQVEHGILDTSSEEGKKYYEDERKRLTQDRKNIKNPPTRSTGLSYAPPASWRQTVTTASDTVPQATLTDTITPIQPAISTNPKAEAATDSIPPAAATASPDTLSVPTAPPPAPAPGGEVDSTIERMLQRITNPSITADTDVTRRPRNWNLWVLPEMGITEPSK